MPGIITITRSSTWTSVEFAGQTTTWNIHNSRGVGHYEMAERTAESIWCSNNFVPTFVRTSSYR
jgi:hypothetical protein